MWVGGFSSEWFYIESSSQLFNIDCLRNSIFKARIPVNLEEKFLRDSRCCVVNNSFFMSMLVSLITTQIQISAKAFYLVSHSKAHKTFLSCKMFEASKWLYDESLFFGICHLASLKRRKKCHLLFFIVFLKSIERVSKQKEEDLNSFINFSFSTHLYFSIHRKKPP